MDTLKFTAEVKEVNAKKTASLDVLYRITLQTSEPTVLALGALEGDSLLNVTMEVGDGQA